MALDVGDQKAGLRAQGHQGVVHGLGKMLSLLGGQVFLVGVIAETPGNGQKTRDWQGLRPQGQRLVFVDVARGEASAKVVFGRGERSVSPVKASK